MSFIHLHTHSHYSLLDGLSKIDGLVSKAKQLGMSSLALTDHSNLYGAIEFYKKCKNAGIKPILGTEIYIVSDRFKKETGEKRHHLTLLVKNIEGWKNLLKIVSLSHLEGFYYKPRTDKILLKENSSGLIALSGCLAGEISRLILEQEYSRAKEKILEYQEIFGKENFFLEIQPHWGIEEYKKIKKPLIALSKETSAPLVATYDSHYLEKEDKKYHQILLSVQNSSKKEEQGFLKDDFSFISEEEIKKLLPDCPEAISNTSLVAEKCNLELEFNKIKLPSFPGVESSFTYLKNLVRKKSRERLENIIPSAEERINLELDVIKKTGFADYFLIISDVIQWAKERGIAVGPGRGSAAGSLIAYILGITEINPLKYNLLFERFLNPERIQPPDIDVDFSDSRREEVFSYVREKYGKDKTAQIITFGTMASRAAIRDAGRALGYSYSFCDEIAKMIPFNLSLQKSLASIPELKKRYEQENKVKNLIEAAQKLEGTARHASVHACGIIISPEPLMNIVPLQLAPQDKNTVITQIEMHTLEELGLLKMDFLGLKNLSIIEETLRMVNKERGEELKIENIPREDKKTFSLLKKGETSGVFQLESSSMKGYLKQLTPDKFEDIIAMVALFRPGPMRLIPSYIRRKQGKEKITYLHPKLETILKETYGLPVYQEQLMLIAQRLAGFSLGEADILRKAIGKKIKNLLLEQKEKMIKGLLKNGMTKERAQKIWEWILPFGGYGFNKSHAACYATIAYHTAYLKAHYPDEFFTSLLNTSFNDIDRIAFLVKDAESEGIKILPPDINRSDSKFSPEEKNKIRFGLLAIKNIGFNLVNEIIKNRVEQGPFENLTDFFSRINHKDLNKKSLESLIKTGTLESLGIEREVCLENLEELLRFSNSYRKSSLSSQYTLFNFKPNSFSLNIKKDSKIDFNRRLSWEKEYLGIYLSGHPLRSRLDKIKKFNIESIEQVKKSKREKHSRIAGVILELKKILTRNGSPMLFIKIEDLTDKMEVLVFEKILSKNNLLFQKNKVLLMEGRISLRNDEPKLICQKVYEI